MRNYYTAQKDLLSSDFPEDGTEMGFDYVRQSAHACLVGSACVGVCFGRKGIGRGWGRIPLEAAILHTSKCCFIRSRMKSINT